MGARAPRASRVERGGFLGRGLNSHLSLTVSHSLCRVTHNTSVTHTSHGTHSRVPASRGSPRRSRPSSPPPRALCAVTRTHALASTLSLSPSYSKTQKTRVGIREGERQSACADATRPPPPEPHVGGHTSGHRSWGAGRGPADAWPGVWRVACRSRAERGVHSARAEVRRGSGLASWPSRKPPLYKF